MALSRVPCDLKQLTKRNVKEYFQNSYDVYEDLFRGIKDEEAFYVYPDALRLPLIFYFGHTAAVYINKLMLAGLIKERVNLEFETLFETGVDEMSWDDTENYRMGDKFLWPSVGNVQKYRDEVRDLILDLIETQFIDECVTQDSPWWSLFMGMEHERIHLETSSVLIRQLPIKYVHKPPNWLYGPLNADVSVNKNPMLKVHSTQVTVGKPHDFPSYGWDNEYGQWTVSVPEFEASKYLITNREFLEFVEDGGYENQKYWSEPGWKWLSFRKARHPTFWVCNQSCKSGCGSELSSYSHCHRETDENKNRIVSMETNGCNTSNRYRYRALFDVIDMPLDWPVDVNYYEAKAYCKWKGPDYRLLTEAEHHVIRGPQKSVSMETQCDSIFDKDFKANANLRYASSTPVNLFPANEAGFHDVFGNVWSWIEDHFNGLPGFKTHYFYDDFSSPTFDGQHFMIMGGSWVSTGDEASRFARFAFRPHFFQHLGFRLARSVTSSPPPVRHINTKVFVRGLGEQENLRQVPGIEEVEFDVPSTNGQYVVDNDRFLLQEAYKYRDMYEGDSMIDGCMNIMNQIDTQRDTALCFMCSLGWSAFQLAKHFNKVVAVDYSSHTTDAAIKLQNEKQLKLTVNQEQLHLKLPNGTNNNRVIFKQLTWLPNEVGNYDFILVTGMERTMNPQAWVVRIREILNPHGLVAIETFEGFDTNAIQSFLGHRFCMIAEKAIGNHPMIREGIRRCDRVHSTIAFWKCQE